MLEYYPYWQYTDLLIFRFVSLLFLRSTLRYILGFATSMAVVPWYAQLNKQLRNNKSIHFAFEASTTGEI